MKGIRKRFNRELHEQNDKLAKEVVLKYLGSGWEENPNTRGVDLVNNFTKQVAECEIKRVWRGSEFPYGDIQIPERKGKYRNLNIQFFVLNNEATHAINFLGNSLLESRLVEVPNKFVYKGEYFYKVPIEECWLIEF